jgi:tetratricopeptide (TPR) repeat protein
MKSRIVGVFFLLTLLLAGACQRKVAVQPPAAALAPDPRIKEWILKGDEFFAHQNLYGWRMAEDFYSRADALGGDVALKEKLLLTRVLLVTRQIDEDVPISALKKNLALSCTSAVNSTGQLFCDFAAKYLAPREPPQRNLDPGANPKILAFATADAVLDDYLHILYARAAAIDLPAEFELSAWEKYKSSPLFMYLNLRKVAAQPTAEVEKNLPDFAELYVLNGEKRLQAGRYRDSRTYFNRTLELVPDYTRAINGLGNILLYVVEDYLEALRFYERALKYDPVNSGGLYGKGVVLHSMGQFADSNQVFDRLISSDLTRGGRLDDSNVRYYRGMGRYYQAYNNYDLFKPQEARTLIDLAKKDLPLSEPVNYLSGVLHFNANDMENAERDFRQLLASGSSNCDAYNYLGLIYVQKDPPRAPQYFLGMCNCVDVAIQSTKRDIASLPRMDLEPAELNQMKARLMEKLSAFRKSSVEMIKNALTMMDLINIKERNFYRKLMQETLPGVAAEQP